MKEIGETFIHNQQTLLVVEKDSCEGCYFLVDNCLDSENMFLCGEKSREDGKSVIFKVLMNDFKFGK